ncbi:MAG: hypothetical protein AAF340_06405 [Pseudomonadota bacterium]
MSEWSEEDRQTLAQLLRLTYLEFCRGASRPELDGVDAQASSLARACRDMHLVRWSWQADRAMATLFNRFYLHSAGAYVTPQRFLEGATAQDREYSGQEIFDFAEFRANYGWTPIFGESVNHSYH